MTLFENRFCLDIVRTLAFLLILTSTSARADRNGDETAVRAVILGLEQSWNAADMDTYLAAYRQDESMSLTYGASVVQGWDALATLFRTSYPDEARMGKFTINSLDVTLIEQHAAIVYGSFTHVFIEETIIGGFSHVLVRERGRWKIQHERTSRAEVHATD